MTKFLEVLNAIVWGAPALVLILGVGGYLSLRTGFPQFALFPRAVKLFLRKLTGRNGEDASSYRCLCTALAATVGTGNLAGVAGAICLGGPGAVFWMWVCGFFGMVTKYAEATLAVRFRREAKGEVKGGPMYIITEGLGEKWHWLAKSYCLFGVLASFGVGNAAQINTVMAGVSHLLPGGLSPAGELRIGLLLAFLVGISLLGGARRIGCLAEKLVPFVSAGYLILCLLVLTLRLREIPNAFGAIFQGALSPRAVTGGVLGSAFQALRIGCSRGVFTNEAGMGTAAIAHGSAEVKHPAEQGLMGIMEVFLDTIVICTMTALVILTSGTAIPYGADTGAVLTESAFSRVLGSWANMFLTGALCCFAFATVLGWGLYGGRCLEFLMGVPAWRGFALAQGVMALLGATMEPGPVWLLADTFNGLMAIPNLFALAMLAPEVRRLTIDYKKSGSSEAGGGNYADFHQCQPLRTLSHAKVSPLRRGSRTAGQEDLPSEHRPA